MTTIESIQIIRVSLPFVTGGPLQSIGPNLGPWQKMECIIANIKTSDGLEGWGEGFGQLMAPGTEAVLNQIIAPMLIGKDATGIRHRISDIERPLHGLGRSGPAQYGISAIDIALWDLAGKRAGLPLFRMLGGRDGLISKYASLMRYGGDTDAVSKNVSRARANGFKIIKLHETTIPAFRAARDAVNNEDNICLDVNCPWTVAEAIGVAQEIRGDDFYWLEEPVWPPEDYAGLAKVKKQGVPISAGENITTPHEFKTALEMNAIDNLQPSVTKCGGISAMQKIFSLSAMYPVQLIPHCFCWGPGYLATAHLAASRVEPIPLETPFISFAVQPHRYFDIASASLALDDSPGLGFDPRWDELEKFVLSANTTG